MTPEEYIKAKGYDPRIIPDGERGPCEVVTFPVKIPSDFKPSDSDNDGPDIRWDKRLCPGQDPEDGFRPKWGGGFFAPRGRYLHAAVDIMAAEGALVVAPSAGTVPRVVRVGRERRPGSGQSRKGGNYVFLVDANGWEWYFAHLRDAPMVSPGAVVSAGSLLGYVGRTGNAARTYRDGSIRGCPHLHLRLGKQLWTPGVARKYDPRSVLQALYDDEDYEG